jgi:hypothetical protein
MFYFSFVGQLSCPLLKIILEWITRLRNAGVEVVVMMHMVVVDHDNLGLQLWLVSPKITDATGCSTTESFTRRWSLH